jgi:cobalt-zinc-cadmium resistance protein CzcA
MTLRELAEFDVRARLLAVPGVAAVEALGGWQRQVQVQIDPERMSARGVTLDDVLHAVEGANAAASGGLVVQGSSEWNVRLLGRASGVEDVRATVVAVREDTPVLLRDVADVVEAPAVRRGIAHRLAGEVVSCRVVKQFGADTVAVSRAVRAAVESLRGSLPSGVRLDVVYDQADLIEQSLGGVERAILLGAALVVAVLIALLGDLRAALVVTLTLPLSVLLAGALLQPFGIGLNTMTLGGLAIAVGLLVDAAIIVVENTVHRLRAANGPARREQALAAALEVARPIAFATLILVAVFAPLFAMSGLEGRMYQPLAAAVVAALAASLALALTLVPLLAGWMLRPAAPGGRLTPGSCGAPRPPTRRPSTRRCGTRSACSPWCCCSPVPRAGRPRASARTSCRRSTRAPSSCRPCCRPRPRSTRSTAPTTASRTRCVRCPRSRTSCGAPGAPRSPRIRCRTRSRTCSSCCGPDASAAARSSRTRCARRSRRCRASPA